MHSISAMRRYAFLAVLTTGMLLASGCSTFSRRWNEVSSTPHQDALGLSGRWEGEWRSDKNRHHGSLRAVATRIDDYRYAIQFRAGFGGIFRFGYRMEMEVTPAQAGSCVLGGQASLGLAGRYQCTGYANGTAFVARYATRGDYGVFELHRPDL